MTIRLTVMAVAVGVALGLPGSTPVAAQQPPAAPVPPRLVLALEAHVQLGSPLEVGQVPRGRRRVIPIVGGRGWRWAPSIPGY